MTLTAAPALGATARIRVNNVPTGSNAPTFMMVGMSRTAFGSASLPVQLDGFGMPGCWLSQDIALEFSAYCASAGPNTAQWSLPIPNMTGLMGLHLYLQPWVYYPPANTAGIYVGQAADLTIGGV